MKNIQWPKFSHAKGSFRRQRVSLVEAHAGQVLLEKVTHRLGKHYKTGGKRSSEALRQVLTPGTDNISWQAVRRGPNVSK